MAMVVMLPTSDDAISGNLNGTSDAGSMTIVLNLLLVALSTVLISGFYTRYHASTKRIRRQRRLARAARRSRSEKRFQVFNVI
jgi:hypothetical protein